MRRRPITGAGAVLSGPPRHPPRFRDHLLVGPGHGPDRHIPRCCQPLSIRGGHSPDRVSPV